MAHANGLTEEQRAYAEKKYTRIQPVYAMAAYILSGSRPLFRCALAGGPA